MQGAREQEIGEAGGGGFNERQKGRGGALDRGTGRRAGFSIGKYGSRAGMDRRDMEEYGRFFKRGGGMEKFNENPNKTGHFC